MGLLNSLKHWMGTDSAPAAEKSSAAKAPAPFVLKSSTSMAPHLSASRSTPGIHTSTLSKMMLQVEQCEEMARTGNTSAQKELPELYHAMGMKYYLGTGVTKNQTDAFEWFLRAAHFSHLPSVFRLSVMMKTLPTAQHALLKVRYWLMKAVDAKNEDALEFLGHLYEFGGKDFPPNPELAQEWYARYNALTMPRCTYAKRAFMNAKLYEQTQEVIRMSGIPSIHSILQAVNWYRYSAEQGYSKAMGRLGLAYEEGELGFEKNETEAKAWYDRYNQSLPKYENDPTVKILGELGLSRGTQVHKRGPFSGRNWLNG